MIYVSSIDLDANGNLLEIFLTSDSLWGTRMYTTEKRLSIRQIQFVAHQEGEMFKNLSRNSTFDWFEIFMKENARWIFMN